MRHTRLVKVSDIVYTAVIVAVMLVIWFFMLPGGQGDVVVFRKDGQVIGTLELGVDEVFEVQGDYTNVFEINGGSVRVTHTDCPGHQCEKTGTISSSGQSIVCAPNHVSATIEGGETDVDALTG